MSANDHSGQDQIEFHHHANHQHQQQQQQQSHPQQQQSQQSQQQQHHLTLDQNLVQQSERKPKAPSVRRACIACHAGKTRCSEVLPCQACLKRGIGANCAYPDPDHTSSPPEPVPGTSTIPFAPPITYSESSTPNLSHQQYYDYNGAFTGASSTSFRSVKRPRPLTEDETQAITRNFSRGDFYVGQSAPVRIDPRLPVRLTLGEGDHVHFTVGEQLI